MVITHKRLGDACQCGESLVMRDNQFYLRGEYYSGLICEKCNALWSIEGNNIFEPIIGERCHNSLNF